MLSSNSNRELEMLAISLCKGYTPYILRYLDDCQARSLEDINILLRAPILFCLTEFNGGDKLESVVEVNKTIKTVKNCYLRTLRM